MTQEFRPKLDVLNESYSFPKSEFKCCSCGPNNKGCKNKQFTEGISFHKYPNKTLYPERFERLVCFMRRHKKDCQLAKMPTLALYILMMPATI